MRPDWDVVWLSDIPWGSLWQRPQQLATRFPPEARILFVEPWTLGHPMALRPTAVTDRIARVSFPFLPLHARSLGQRRLAYRLGDSALGAGSVVALQRAWAGTLRGFGRPGTRRLALVENFLARPSLGAFRPDRVVYDMIDAPLHFAPVPPRLVPQWERLLREADRVSVTSALLLGLARAGGAREPRVIGNGVEAERFRSAAPASGLPGDPRAPILGYVGSLHSWFDLPLVTSLARARPATRVVLVGPAPPATREELVRAQAELPNLHWLGPKPYTEVASLVRSFRVGLIPFRRTPLTEAVNPVKLYEYAAAGVPCVTTRFTDEVEGWREVARVAGSPEEFLAACDAALQAPPDPESLFRFARKHDWDEIAREFVRFALEDAA
ncbi:MAG TPA: glycosyltransferase [Candidatus Polarisedimenticolia bacterium]|nr:glycosyltransferase [Candidatus Polarisedimenticolia bacterium]